MTGIRRRRHQTRSRAIASDGGCQRSARCRPDRPDESSDISWGSGQSRFVGFSMRPPPRGSGVVRRAVRRFRQHERRSHWSRRAPSGLVSPRCSFGSPSMPSVKHRHAEYRHSPATALDRDPYRRLRARGSDSLARNLFGCSIRTSVEFSRRRSTAAADFVDRRSRLARDAAQLQDRDFTPTVPGYRCSTQAWAPRHAMVVAAWESPESDGYRSRTVAAVADRAGDASPTCAARSRCSSKVRGGGKRG